MNGQEFSASVSAEGRFSRPEQFENILLRTNPNGTSVRLKDVARVELGQSQYGFETRIGKTPISPPTGLSARNIIPGYILSVEQHDVIVFARVKCRVEMEVHLTLAARDSLELKPGKEVWLVIKTHSCHLMGR